MDKEGENKTINTGLVVVNLWNLNSVATGAPKRENFKCDHLAHDRTKAEKYQSLRWELQMRQCWAAVLSWRALHLNYQNLLAAIQKADTRVSELINQVEKRGEIAIAISEVTRVGLGGTKTAGNQGTKATGTGAVASPIKTRGRGVTQSPPRYTTGIYPG